jgi:hypothetical protein
MAKQNQSRSGNMQPRMSSRSPQRASGQHAQPGPRGGGDVNRAQDDSQQGLGESETGQQIDPAAEGTTTEGEGEPLAPGGTTDTPTPDSQMKEGQTKNPLARPSTR